MRIVRTPVIIATALLALGLGACGGSSSKSSSAPRPARQRRASGVPSSRQACIDSANRIPNETSRKSLLAICDKQAK